MLVAATVVQAGGTWANGTSGLGGCPTSLAPGAARAVIAPALRVGAAPQIDAAFDARRLLTTTNQPNRRPRPSPVAQPAAEHRGARWALLVMIVLIAIAIVIACALATAPPP